MKISRSFTPVALLAVTLATGATFNPASAQVLYETSKILASDGGNAGFGYDRFGSAAAIDGVIAIVGAAGHEKQGFLSGSAYLFDISDPANPTEIAELLPIGGLWNDNFGGSVDISGTTVVVGADQINDPISGPGSAYLFDVTTGTQIAELLPNDPQADDAFGCSVAIDGSTVIIGARRDDDMGDGSGSVYVFDANTGMQVDKLVPADGGFQHLFGIAVALNGTIALIGADLHDENNFSGAAYLFDTSDGTQLAKFFASDGEILDFFGITVAIHGTIAIIAATGDDDNGHNTGSAYLFDISIPTNPVELSKLVASDGAAFHYFGRSVAVNENYALVGSRNDVNGDDSGCAYLFDISDPSNPVEVTKLLSSDNEEFDWFGTATALGETTALVTANNDDNILGFNVGAGYLFNLTAHPNDECTNPIEIAGEGTFSFDTTGVSQGSDPATTGSVGQDEGPCLFFGSDAVNNDIWYSWTADSTGLATVTFCGGGTNHDTKIAAWPAACPPVPGSILACNDDTCGLQSQIQFEVVASTAYLIQVGSYDPLDTGSGFFDISILGSGTDPGIAFCFGDGGGTTCPCANNGAANAGCGNSGSATGGVLSSSGDPIVGADTIVLAASNCPPTKPGIFFSGTNQANGGNGFQFGDGLLCMTSGIDRLEVVFLDGSGSAESTVVISVEGGVLSGQTLHYQYWFRDNPHGACTSAFNTTNALTINWH
jgi:hypothetical protein